jgi:hypothetical protein
VFLGQERKMSENLLVTIAPEMDRVRLLVQHNQHDILKAVFCPVIHPKAASTLLEGLALWYQRRLSVVLSVDDRDNGSGLALFDALGFGKETLHYEVGVAVQSNRPKRIAGLGSFRDLRQLSLVSEVCP